MFTKEYVCKNTESRNTFYESSAHTTGKFFPTARWNLAASSQHCERKKERKGPLKIISMTRNHLKCTQQFRF